MDETINSLREKDSSGIDDEKTNDHEDEVNLVAMNDQIPETYKQAIASCDADKWRAAMDEEIESQRRNKTWVVERLPQGQQVIGNKWVYAIKRDADNNITRFKARLVSKGFTQRYEIDYSEAFSPAPFDSIRLIMTIVAELDMEAIHLDVKTAFLYGELKEEIWMKEPEGYEIGKGRAWRLLKSLYGLKQASRCWNECFISFLKKFNIEPIKTDSCVLVGRKSGNLIIIVVYVDDGFVCFTNRLILEEIVSHMERKFEITVTEPRLFVGLEIMRDRKRRQIFVSQQKYVQELVRRFELEDARVANVPMATTKYVVDGVADGPKSKIVDVPYKEAIGSLIYLTTSTRPDIGCAVSTLSRFCQLPKLSHWLAIKQVVRYLKETCQLALCYQGKGELKAFSDADYAGCLDTRKSRSGILIMRREPR